MAAGYHALAEIDSCRQRWAAALEHLNRSLRFNTDNLRARNLKAIVLRKLRRDKEAKKSLHETLALDPLDWWARHLRGEKLKCDSQTALDFAHDFTRAGFIAEAIELLTANATQKSGERFSLSRRRGRVRANENTTCRTKAGARRRWCITRSAGCNQKIGGVKSALASFQTAAAQPPDYCFPSRLEEIAILEAAMRANPSDAKAPYYLGNLFYDRRRHVEAIKLWEKSAKLDPDFSIVWRNLGIGYFNISKNPAKARAAYDKAFRANPADARLLFERDQLWKRLGEKPEKRLRELEKHPQLVSQRDDLSVEFCALLNQTGRHCRGNAIVGADEISSRGKAAKARRSASRSARNLALGRDGADSRDDAVKRGRTFRTPR